MTALKTRDQTAPRLGRFSEADLATLDAARQLLKQHLVARPVITSWQMLTDYLALMNVDERVEVFRVLFLDTKNRLICDETMSRGTIDQTSVYVREVMRRALELDASALILCHDHPSGDPTPSNSDIIETKKIQDACNVLGLTLHDHVIVAFGRESDAYSMKSKGDF